MLLPAIEWAEGWMVPLPPDGVDDEWAALTTEGLWFCGNADHLRSEADDLLAVAVAENADTNDEERASAEAYRALADLIEAMTNGPTRREQIAEALYRERGGIGDKPYPTDFHAADAVLAVLS